LTTRCSRRLPQPRRSFNQLTTRSTLVRSR
jgi:hypothetical protein